MTYISLVLFYRTDDVVAAFRQSTDAWLWVNNQTHPKAYIIEEIELR